MAAYRLSPRAEADLLEIGAFTREKWGYAQADRYLSELEACFLLIASRPGIGRACDRIEPGMRRIETGKHVVFFQLEADTVVIWRILHQRRIPERRLFDLDEE